MEMENGPYISDFPIKTSIHRGFIPQFSNFRSSHPMITSPSFETSEQSSRSLSHSIDGFLGIPIKFGLSFHNPPISTVELIIHQLIINQRFTSQPLGWPWASSLDPEMHRWVGHRVCHGHGPTPAAGTAGCCSWGAMDSKSPKHTITNLWINQIISNNWQVVEP